MLVAALADEVVVVEGTCAAVVEAAAPEDMALVREVMVEREEEGVVVMARVLLVVLCGAMAVAGTPVPAESGGFVSRECLGTWRGRGTY